LRSHPLTTERIADMQSRQALLAPNPVKASLTFEHAMVAARARVLSNPGVDALRALLVEASGPQLAALTAPRQSAALYGAALAASRLRDFASAKTSLNRLTGLVRSDAAAARLVRLLEAEIALTAGDLAHAASLVQTNPPLKPASMGVSADAGRPELLLWAQIATQAGPAVGATVRDVGQRLQLWVAAHPRDAQAWQLLSTAYAGQGQTLLAIRADAETHVAMLDYPAALDRLKAAQELLKHDRASKLAVDHIDASIIDTRHRQVEALLKEQALDR
jgi:predicted Zn-dependent protease